MSENQKNECFQILKSGSSLTKDYMSENEFLVLNEEIAGKCQNLVMKIILFQQTTTPLLPLN